MAVKISDNEGKPDGQLTVAADALQFDNKISELLAENSGLKAQNSGYRKTIDDLHRLFSIISHDVRSPINAIAGYLEAAAENLFSESERAQMDKELLTRVHATSDMLTNMLTWSKGQVDGIKPEPAPNVLKDILHDSLLNLKQKAADKGIVLTNNMGNNTSVICDKGMMLIVVRNIVNNAIKFTPAGGHIEIRSAEKDGNVIVAVKDNGIGIATDKKDAVAEMNFNSTYGTNGEKGVGLGLKLCKEFMHYQHGRIWFESEAGEGTTFYISIPGNATARH